jgi:hypothetical protein
MSHGDHGGKDEARMTKDERSTKHNRFRSGSYIIQASTFVIRCFLCVLRGSVAISIFRLLIDDFSTSAKIAKVLGKACRLFLLSQLVRQEQLSENSQGGKQSGEGLTTARTVLFS